MASDMTHLLIKQEDWSFVSEPDDIDCETVSRYSGFYWNQDISYGIVTTEIIFEFLDPVERGCLRT